MILIVGLGNPGDLVQVKSGYGRNYLLPSGKAIIANEENMKVYEAKQEELKLQEEKRKLHEEKMKRQQKAGEEKKK